MTGAVSAGMVMTNSVMARQDVTVVAVISSNVAVGIDLDGPVQANDQLGSDGGDGFGCDGGNGFNYGDVEWLKVDGRRRLSESRLGYGVKGRKSESDGWTKIDKRWKQVQKVNQCSQAASHMIKVPSRVCPQWCIGDV